MQKETKPTLQNNSFALAFDLEELPNGKFRRGEMAFSFDGAGALIQDDQLTELGYQILISTLADAIVSLTDTAGKTTKLKTSQLRNMVADRMEVKEAKRVIIGGNKKLIGI